MGKVIVMNSVTLDGVMQGPGRPDEDTRDGFDARRLGGSPYGDEAMVAKMGERMGEDRAFLFGRRTYEQLLASWNARGGPFKDALNDTRKFVASSSPATRLDWPNSTLLHGDVPAAVAELKRGLRREPRDHGQRRPDRLADGRRCDRRVPADDRSSGAGHADGGCLPAVRKHRCGSSESVATSTGVVMATYERAA